jgi:hypothetical protein
MTPEAERETLRQMIIGALAIELPAEAFEVLMDVDNRQRRKMNQPTGDPDTEQGA